MDGWQGLADELKTRVEMAGFYVFEKKVTYASLSGEVVEEKRLIGYSPRGDVKLSYSENRDGGRLSFTLSGDSASKSLAERMERLGGMVDLDEGKRLYAVFTGISRKRAGELIERLFGKKPSKMGGEDR